MNTTTDAIIAVRIPRFTPLGRFRITIDGQRVGTLKQGTTDEFEVKPGVHKVGLAFGWPMQSPELELEVDPGSKNALVVQRVPGSRHRLKYSLGLFLAFMISTVVEDVIVPDDIIWFYSYLVLLPVFLGILILYQLVTKAVSREYWVSYELIEDGTQLPLGNSGLRMRNYSFTQL